MDMLHYCWPEDSQTVQFYPVFPLGSVLKGKVLIKRNKSLKKSLSRKGIEYTMNNIKSAHLALLVEEALRGPLI